MSDFPFERIDKCNRYFSVMSKVKKESFFWTSYSDLMTSLFFIMLVMFVLVVVLLHNKITGLVDDINEYEKIEEIKKAINEINENYFEYSPEYKKHIFKLQVQYPTGVFDISKITNPNQLTKIKDAGKEIVQTIEKLARDNTVNIQYLIIIEGQASADNYNKDDFLNNDVLSYQRALGLRHFWERNGVSFTTLQNCELIVAGSGEGGVPRETPDWQNPVNQRFLIHIIPKPGIIKLNKN